MGYPALQTIRDEHAALAAMVRSLGLLADRGPQGDPARFFEVVRAVLFYIDEFPERLHHPKESSHLFPKLARVAPELIPVLHRLEPEHLNGERRVRELQHLLTAWELLGGARREAFLAAAHDDVRFQLSHIETEETQVLPLAGKLLPAADWQELVDVFAANADRWRAAPPAIRPTTGCSAGSCRRPRPRSAWARSKTPRSIPAANSFSEGLRAPNGPRGAYAACNAG